MKLTAAGSSPMDEAGIEAIKESRTATFDLTDGELTRADVGLTADDIAPMIAMDESEPIAVTIKGANGEATIETPTLKLFTASGWDTIDYLTLFRVFEDDEALVAEVGESVEKYGVDPSKVESWTSNVGANPEDAHGTNFPIGSKLGPGVQMELHWDEGEPRKVLVYTITPAG
ncbi:hypothetical protein BJ994_002559 [Arthrobacter pigmenti]|uniref:Uncharacterized protein n=1 Tax=Arthrobacter pigmenti TaxID=271432 RepID=A0A846RJR9_9MICC|nr:hypothetical protein [Arthrobacter pigmenti]NJC23483.1 hypothetical protein [Arthrobacter pigmenti]